jgi:prepilin-type N-terminal cleavage/methylation domain-containing protein
MNLLTLLRSRNRSGFTLLELLVVIAVAAILVSVASASYSTAQKKARDGRRMGDMKAIQNAAEQFYADSNSAYPASKAAFTATYLPNGFPYDPKCPAGTCAAGFTDYAYTVAPVGCTTACTSYVLTATLESGSTFTVKNLQ